MNPLEKDYSDYQKLVSSGLKTQEALSKMKLSKPPPSREENYQFLLDVWNHESMCAFKDFLRWYNNKDVVPTLEAMQKLLAFYHKKGNDMLKLGYTLLNLANICLHKTTSAKLYPFTEIDKYLLRKIREDMVGGPSFVFARKAVVDETFILNPGNICKSIVGIDASQLYPYSMCQPMTTGLYTRWEYDTESNRFKPQQNKIRNFENMVMLYFQRQTPECKIESFYTTGTQKKIDCFKVDGFCAHCKTVFEAMGCFYHYCPCQEARPSLTEEDIERGNKKREMDQMRKQYIEEKGFNVVEIWEYEWWNLYKTTTCVKQHLRESFPYKRPLREESLLEKIKSGKLFGYVQCDIEEGHRCQSRKMLISSYFLEKGTLITPLLLFYLELGLVCKKNYRSVEYTPGKCFNKLVQSAVNARREGDENLNSGVVAETMKVLANSSYRYQIMDCSRHTVTKYLSDEKTHDAINTNVFKRLDNINGQLYEVELAKAEIEHREPIIVGFSKLQYAKLRMLELYYNFFQRFCDVNQFEELEMNTDSLYLALSQKEMYDCIREASKTEWGLMRTEDCKNDFTANATTNFFSRTCCTKHLKHDKRELVFSKRSFVVRKCCVYAAKPILVMTPIPTNTNSAAKA